MPEPDSIMRVNATLEPSGEMMPRKLSQRLTTRGLSEPLVKSLIQTPRLPERLVTYTMILPSVDIVGNWSVAAPPVTCCNSPVGFPSLAWIGRLQMLVLVPAV